MKKITLIGVMHKEIGKCNTDELYNILEIIKPDIIFEETSVYKNMLTYTWGIDPNSPELRAIQKYIQNYRAKCIPIDNFKRPENFKELEDNFALAFINKNEKNIELYKLFDISNEYIKKNGIKGMNTKYFDELNRKKQKLCDEYIKNYILEIIEKYDEYENIIFEKRENIMIETIYEFSNNYNNFNAALVIGADHRVTIIDKLKKINNIEFSFYLGDN